MILEEYWPVFLTSGALSGKGGKWTEKTLDKYLKSPADYAPGKCKQFYSQIRAKRFIWINCQWKYDAESIYFEIGNAMAFAGLANAKDRADVIAYLKSNSWTFEWKTQFIGAKQVFYAWS